MNLDQGGDSETRFAEYVAGLGSVIGHVERTRPLRDYCTGLMLPGERKSVEPMAARTACVYRKLKLGCSGGEVHQGWRVI